MTKKLDMLLGSQSPDDPPAQKAQEPKTTTEVIKVKTEKPKTKKPDEAAPAAKPAAVDKKAAVIDDKEKEDENGWFSFLKDFGF